jgi:tetratricopeptide (TPR) repeat protein
MRQRKRKTRNPVKVKGADANLQMSRSLGLGPGQRLKRKARPAAHGHYLRGIAIEDADARAAREAYEACLAGDWSHIEARINLGRLLHLEGNLRDAEKVYLATEEPSAILYFNLGVLLEDLERELDAVAAYRRALVHDPGMGDAHFNLSALHDRLGETQAAFRHLLAYRRLLQAQDSKSAKEIQSRIGISLGVRIRESVSRPIRRRVCR